MKHGTAVVNCTCNHDFQDKKYGHNRRIANATQKSKVDNKTDVRCTVCKTVHTVNNSQVK